MNILSSILKFIGNFLETKQIEPSITATTGVLGGTWGSRQGNVVNLRIQVSNTASVSSGNNLFAGTIASPLPINGAAAASYVGGAAAIAQLSAAGNIVVRVSGGTISANSSVYLTFCYLAT